MEEFYGELGAQLKSIWTKTDPISQGGKRQISTKLGEYHEMDVIATGLCVIPSVAMLGVPHGALESVSKFLKNSYILFGIYYKSSPFWVTFPVKNSLTGHAYDFAVGERQRMIIDQKLITEVIESRLFEKHDPLVEHISDTEVFINDEGLEQTRETSRLTLSLIHISEPTRPY